MAAKVPQASPGPEGSGRVVIYRDGAMRLQVRLEGRTAWLSQRLIAELYQVSVKTVNEHLVNIYGEAELDREATIRRFRIVQREGGRDVSRAHARHGWAVSNFAAAPPTPLRSALPTVEEIEMELSGKPRCAWKVERKKH